MMVIQLRGDAVVVYQTVIQLHGDGPVCIKLRLDDGQF